MPSSVAARKIRIAISLRFPTISYTDSLKTDWKAFDALANFLRVAFPKVNAECKPEVIGGHSLLFRWEGRKPENLPVMFYAHQDVVPVESENGEGWTYPPFSGEIADGYIWGRGALDTKSLIVCQLEAAERLIAAGYFDAHADRYVRRFALADIRVVEVKDDFPRLTPGSVPLGVTKATYEIDLDKVLGPSIPTADALKKLGAI